MSIGKVKEPFNLRVYKCSILVVSKDAGLSGSHTQEDDWNQRMRFKRDQDKTRLQFCDYGYKPEYWCLALTERKYGPALARNAKHETQDSCM